MKREQVGDHLAQMIESAAVEEHALDQGLDVEDCHAEWDDRNGEVLVIGGLDNAYKWSINNEGHVELTPC